MCTTVGCVVSTNIRSGLEAQITAWMRKQERSVHISLCTPYDLRVFLEGVADQEGLIAFEVGAAGSGCSCGLYTECEGPDGEAASDPIVARRELGELLSMVCATPIHWLRFGFTDRYYDLTVTAVSQPELIDTLVSGDFPEETIMLLTEA